MNVVADPAKLAQLKAAVQSHVERVRPEYDEYDLGRFLRQKKNDVEKAKTAILNHLKWYEENNIKKRVDQFETDSKYDFLRSYVPSDYYAGVDKNGSPWYYERLGCFDAKNIWNRATMDECVFFHIYQQERGMRMRRDAAKKLGKSINSFVFIEDAQGVSYAHMNKRGLELSKQNFLTDETHYPLLLEKMFIIRAPKVFTAMWALIKPFIDENTLQVIKIYGNTGWESDVLSAIPADQLPPEFGGKNTTVPLKKGGSCALDGSPEGATTVVVSRKHEIEIPVSVAGSIIYYDFITAAYDIGFGISCDGVEKVAMVRYDGQEQAQGTLTCATAGKYLITFDNSFSLFRSKTVTYRIECVRPDENDLIAV